MESAGNVSTSSDPQMNFFQRLVGVFVSPEETFEDVKRAPKWVAPLVLVLLVTLVFTMLITPISVPEQMEKQRDKMAERGMSDAQIDQALETGMRFAKIGGPIGAIFGTLAITALFAAVLLFLGNIVLGGSCRFGDMWAVVIYSYLVPLLGMLIKLPLIMSKQTVDVPLGLGTFLEQGTSFSYHLLKGVEIFSVWQFFVMAIGFAVFYRFSKSKAYITVFALFVVTLLIQAGLASMAS